MALNVISNFAANVAHRNLSINDRMTTASLAKLSSGSRVTSAKDDAASLAIGSRLNAEVQAQRQAQINATQATSMLQIADGAMAKVSDILIRMKTLAVQSGSGQLSNTERAFLDTEYQALVSEIDRIAADTEFNGVQMVNGSSTTTTNTNSQTTGGNNVLETIDGFQSFAFDNGVGDAAVRVSFDAALDVLTLTNLATGTSQGVNIGSTAIAANTTQVVNFENLGTTVTLNSAFDKTADIAPASAYTPPADTDAVGAIDASSIQVTGATDFSGAVNALAIQTISVDAAAATGAVFTLGDFTGAVNLSATGATTVTLDNGSSADITIGFTVSTAFTDTATTASLTAADLGSLVFGSATTTNSTSFDFKLGTGTTANVDDVTFSVTAVSVSALGFTAATNILDTTAADAASVDVTAAIDALNTARSGVGAGQNRLEFASDNLATTIENSEAARSNLMDLDLAAEITTFTSKQVLVQVGVSMLSQANQLPQNLLQLLQ